MVISVKEEHTPVMMSLDRQEGNTDKQTGDAFRTEQRHFEFMKT